MTTIRKQLICQSCGDNLLTLYELYVTERKKQSHQEIMQKYNTTFSFCCLSHLLQEYILKK